MTSPPDLFDGAAFSCLTDGNGYGVSPHDFEFLRLSDEAVEAMRTKQLPLGMDEDQYTEFVDTLLHALDREGVTDADVRLQGSSVHFFSGWHKCLPESREQITELYAKLNNRPPSKYELDHCCRTLFGQWPALEPRPHRRPFDSMKVVGLDPSPSDYDVQISSDQMIEIVHKELQRLGNKSASIRLENSIYDFVKKHYTEHTFLYVSTWASIATQLVGRPVTWALFPSQGPTRDDKNYRLSSHFKSTDWIVREPTHQQLGEKPGEPQ